MTNDESQKTKKIFGKNELCDLFVKVCVCFLPLAPVIGWVHFFCYAGRL